MSGGAVRISEDSIEVVAGEFPTEWGGDILIVGLEGEDAVGDRMAGIEVVGSERLALKD